VAGSEFKALSSQLSGQLRPGDEATHALLLTYAKLRQELKKAEEKLRTRALEELKKAIRLHKGIDEEENFQLRAVVKLQRERFQGGRHMPVYPLAQGLRKPKIRL
jgi:hypothetical protein